MAGAGQTSYLASDPSSEETFSQVQRWMPSCVDDHSVCRLLDSTCLPLRVIDVGTRGTGGAYSNPFLSVGANRPGRYATLSYRWGNMCFTTTTSTIEQRKTSMPLSSTPQTFQTAIEITRRLNIRYLWIDALRIIQELLQHWQEQSAIMGQIYANSWLNLSVSAATSPGSGFLKQRNLRNPQLPPSIPSRRFY